MGHILGGTIGAEPGLANLGASLGAEPGRVPRQTPGGRTWVPSRWVLEKRTWVPNLGPRFSTQRPTWRLKLASISASVNTKWHPFVVDSPPCGIALAAQGGRGTVSARALIDAFLLSVRDLLLHIWPGGNTTLLSGVCVAQTAANDLEEFLHPAPPSAGLGLGPAPAPPVMRELVLGVAGFP